MSGVNDKDFPKIRGQLGIVAQIVDRLSDRPMLGHRNQFALHQPAGGSPGIRPCRLDCSAIVGVQRAQDSRLTGVVYTFADRNGIAGVKLGSDLGNLGAVKRVNHTLADVIVHFGLDVPIEHVAERCCHCPASVLRRELEQNGNICRAQWQNEIAGPFVVACVNAGDHRTDEVGSQSVVLIDRGRGAPAVARPFPRFGGQVGLAHRLYFRPLVNVEDCASRLFMPRSGQWESITGAGSFILLRRMNRMSGMTASAAHIIAQ